MDPRTPLRIYYYYDLTDTGYFCRKLEQRFRETGHDRPLEFISWNCYKQLPGRDGDLYIYDVIALSALADKGFLHRLPEVIDVSDMFPWTITCSQVRGHTYGVPLMLCANALICRKEDDRNIRSIFDLHERTAIPLKTMLMHYYLQAFVNMQNDSAVKIIRHLTELMGGREALAASSLAEYDGVRRFTSGECRYFLGFTESLRCFDPGDYSVRFASFSENPEDQTPLFMADFASLGTQVREEKLLDCLDLLELMTDEDFLFDLCAPDGKLQYMLPSRRSVYARLSALDPLYGRLYRQLLPEENSLFRYGKAFYEEFYRKIDEIMKALMAEAPVAYPPPSGR